MLNQGASTRMIRHTVVFRLKHSPGSPEEASFLEATTKLADIPTVKKFECLRQISQKNNYQFGLSMEFDDQPDYQRYNEHPDHVAFVKGRWTNEVTDFMEIDYQPLKQRWMSAS
jgi:hypothetical protein